MSTAEDLLELARLSRERIAETARLREEHLAIREASLRRIEQTRVLLDRSAERTRHDRGATCD